MTPKMSLRRNNIMAVYGSQVLAMYQGKVGVAIPKGIVPTDDDE